MSERTGESNPEESNETTSTAPLLPPILPASHGDPFASMKRSMRRKGTSSSSDSGSSCNDNNASDNSALVSIGNNSFGFNFPNESSNGSDSDGGPDGQDNNPPSNRPPPPPAAVSGSSTSGASNSNANSSDDRSSFARPNRNNSSSSPACGGSPTNSDSSSSSKSNEGPSQARDGSKEEEGPAMTRNRKFSPEESAAMLKTIASSCVPSDAAAQQPMAMLSQAAKRSNKDFEDGSEEGYNSDNDDDDDHSDGHQSKKSRSQESLDGEPRPGRRRSKKINDKRREERNAREKERSFRIAKQINELRDLLSAGGVILPKGTKSSVLTEAASYIRLLQQHQLRSEVERHQLIQQMHMIGGGANGPQAAQAIRHAAAQNGVWSLGNFGGVPPKSAMQYPPVSDATPISSGSSVSDILQHSVSIEDYRFIFNSAGVGMAVSSMGGSLIDCNELFSRLSGYTKQELCALTIFNLTARCDLQSAFDLISQMISPPSEDDDDVPKQVLLRGTLKHRNDLGLSVSLVKGENGVAKCFCITLIKSPASPFSAEEPVPVSFETVLRNGGGKSAAPGTLDTLSSAMAGSTGKFIATTPAFTSG